MSLIATLSIEKRNLILTSKAINMETGTNFLTASFSDLESADKAYHSLRHRGYSDDEINVVMSEDTMKRYFDEEKRESKIGTKAKEGAGTGAAIGGGIGAAAGIIAAIGTTIVIPGLGFAIAGPIAAGLAGAGGGGIAGGLIGAMVGAGIPKKRAEKYEKGLNEGNIVIGVQCHNDEDCLALEKEWNSYGHDVYR